MVDKVEDKIDEIHHNAEVRKHERKQKVEDVKATVYDVTHPVETVEKVRFGHDDAKPQKSVRSGVLTATQRVEVKVVEVQGNVEKRVDDAVHRVRRSSVSWGVERRVLVATLACVQGFVGLRLIANGRWRTRWRR